MPGNREQIQEKLRRLSQNYASKLPDKISEISQVWQCLLRDRADREQLQLLIRLCHTLAGTAASFGFDEVTRVSREIEHKLAAIKADDHGLPDSVSHEINDLLMALKKQEGLKPSNPADSGTILPGQRNIATRRLIYILEKDKDCAGELANNIHNYGYTVELFDQQDALDHQIQQQTPTAIIVTTPLQCEDDMDLLARIGKYSTNIPLILVTDVTETYSRLMAIRAGVKAFFTKPVDIISLIDVLDQYTNDEAADPYRIMIIDDSISSAEFYAGILEQAGMETCIISDPMQVMDTINTFSPELILMDLYMPQYSGDELAELIRQQETYIGTPIVFLSFEDNVEKQLSAMQHGADDFLTKPIPASHLVTSIRSRANRFRKLRSLMFKDSLTGLYNHTTMAEILSRELDRAARNNMDLSYVMIDIDHFKQVNDTYGHAAGDNIIKALSRLLRQRLRKSDYVGRYGGEEFSIIIPDNNAETVVSIIEDLRLSFAETKHNIANHEIYCTFSAGIADRRNGKIPASLAKAADEALYRAKQQGRNQVVVAGSES